MNIARRNMFREKSIRARVEGTSFPNQIIANQHQAGTPDFYGRKIPTRQILTYLSQEGTKVDRDKLYGQYMDESGNTFWIRFEMASEWAMKKYGYTKASLDAFSHSDVKD